MIDGLALVKLIVAFFNWRPKSGQTRELDLGSDVIYRSGISGARLCER